MIVTEAQADGAAGGEAGEVFLDALANRLQRFKPSRSLDGVDAHAFRRTVIDSGKHRHRTLCLGKRGSGIGAPHLIGRLGQDRPVVRVVARHFRLAQRRKQVMLPQQPENAVFRSAHASVTQAGPDLPITFSGENGLGQKLTNLSYELLVGVYLGSTFLWLPRLLLALSRCVKTRPREVPHRSYPCHTIRLITGRRNGAAHGFHFQNAKGRPSSSRAIFSRNSSLSTLTLATTDFHRGFSSSSTSISRLFNTASPPAKKRSRHSVRVAAVTRCLRDVLSRSAPRRSSRMTDTLRLDDHRPPPAVAIDAGASSVALRAPSDAPASCFFGLDMHSLL